MNVIKNAHHPSRFQRISVGHWGDLPALLLCFVCTLFLSVSSQAQTNTASVRTRITAAKPFTQEALRGLVAENVLPQETLSKQVKARGVNFRLNTEQEEEWRGLGASDELLDSMRTTYRGPNCPPVVEGAPVSALSIVTMLQAGTASVCVEQIVKARGISFTATPETLSEIKSAGGTEGLLATLRAKAQKRAEPAVQIADGTRLRMQLTSPIDTRTNQVGDKFTAVILFPAPYENAEVSGHIANLNRSGRMTGKTELGLAFDSIRLSNGRTGVFHGQVEQLVMSDSVKSVDNEGNLRSASQTSKTVKRGAGGAALGALIGAIAGGGKGAAIGAIIGGSAGAGSMLIQGAADVVLEPGTEMSVVSASPAQATHH